MPTTQAWARRIAWSSLAIATLACGKTHEQAPPPPVVSVTEVIQRDVTVYREYVGTLDAYVRAEARARVAGTILEQNYREGSFVKAGSLLFTIDPAPFRAAKLQAEGQLEQARAALEKADADIARYTPLVAKRAVSKEQLENAVAASHSAKGQVALAKGTLEQADLNLGYTRVVAPVDGIADIAQVRVGNLVGQGSPTLLTSVSTVDPIRFTFQITEARYLELAERIKRFSETPPPPPNEPSDEPTRSLQLVLAGDRLYPLRGYIAVVGSQVDPTTGTLTVQAFFPNPDALLRPGQYARMRITDKFPDALLVPERSVSQTQGQNQLAIVGADGKAEVRTVALGAVSGSFVIVNSGVKPGERVVVDGVQKVKPGQPVATAPADTSTLQLSSAAVEIQNAPAARAVDAGPPQAAPSAAPNAPRGR
jgi:membrane fusion protein (multidrug efflux system)